MVMMAMEMVMVTFESEGDGHDHGPCNGDDSHYNKRDSEWSYYGLSVIARWW